MDRPVAVKIPRPYRLASPEQADLFRQEAKRVARLRHPGIVPVFDAGQDGEVFYIISDLIDGTNLAVRIAADRPSHRDAARIVAEVAYSRDGSRALTGSEDRTAALWDTETWSIKLRLAGHDSFVMTVAFAPDGVHAVTGSGMTWSHEERKLVAGTDNTVRLWDLANGDEVRRFAGHFNWVNSVAVSPDGRCILSGGGGHIEEDGRWTAGEETSIRLWGLRSGEEIRRFPTNGSPVRSVAFSPDDGFALSGGDDGMVYLWKLP